jgi:hypothetical protein
MNASLVQMVDFIDTFNETEALTGTAR